MSEINHFKRFVLYSGDMIADVNHLHIKRIHLEFLMGHVYIVREDSKIRTYPFTIVKSSGW
jgi:hypothetical protein